MKRKTVRTKAAVDPTHLSIHDLMSIEGWEELESSEQTTIRSETVELDRQLIVAGQARLKAGEHLFNIREILKPKRMFTRYLDTLKFSRASANRYIDQYTAAKDLLSGPVMQQAMLRGVDRISLRKIEETPPPNTDNVVAINEYLDTITSPTPQEPETNPALLKKEVYNTFDNRFQRLPTAGRTRTAFALAIAGMILTRAGFTTAQNVAPVAIPEDYRSTFGRPRLKTG